MTDGLSLRSVKEAAQADRLKAEENGIFEAKRLAAVSEHKISKLFYVLQRDESLFLEVGLHIRRTEHGILIYEHLVNSIRFVEILYSEKYIHGWRPDRGDALSGWDRLYSEVPGQLEENVDGLRGLAAWGFYIKGQFETCDGYGTFDDMYYFLGHDIKDVVEFIGKNIDRSNLGLNEFGGKVVWGYKEIGPQLVEKEPDLDVDKVTVEGYGMVAAFVFAMMLLSFIAWLS